MSAREPFEDSSMSYTGIENRVGALEGDVRKLSTEVSVLTRDMNYVKDGNNTILQELKVLSAKHDNLSVKQAQQPRPTNWPAVLITVGAVASAIGTFGVGTWWFIGTSPVIQDLDKRLTRLDDPETGKVTRLQEEKNWWPNVKKAER